MIDLLGVENAIAQAVVDTIAPVEPQIGVAVLRYPQRPEEGQGQGDAGRPAAIYVGFSSLDRIPSTADESAFTPHTAKISRRHRLEYNFVFESYEFVDNDLALTALTMLTGLEGLTLPLPGASPLEFNVSFGSHDNGYWLYEGDISFEIDQILPVVAPSESTERKPVKSYVIGIYKHPIGKVDDRDAGAFDQTIELTTER